MGHDYALLLLAQPPQSTILADIRVALYPTLAASVERLAERAVTNKSLFDIALPLTRLANECETHAELFARSREILAGVYKLLSSILEEKESTISRNCPGGVDIRVLLVQEANANTNTFLLPPIVHEFNAFAASGRPWTRLFYVDSPQGDDIYRKFRASARKKIPAALLDYPERLPGGIQLFNPIAMGRESISTNIANYNQRVIVGVETGKLDLSDKFRLTMGLMALPRENTDGLLGKGVMASSILIAVHGGKRPLTADAGAFLLAVMADAHLSTQESDTLQPEAKDSVWERVLWDGIRITISLLEDIYNEDEKIPTVAIVSSDTMWLASTMRDEWEGQVFVEEVCCIGSL
jgi:hypothetical protein